MRTWIHPDFPDTYAALQAAAERWIGTPFFPNSDCPGPRGGVSCQKLVAAIYREAGFCDVEVPEVPMAHARFSTRSLVVDFLAGLPQFIRMQDTPPLAALPGDLLGFRLLRTIHHLGICVRPGVFIHAIEHIGTTFCPLADPTWARRLEGIWRPVIP